MSSHPHRPDEFWMALAIRESVLATGATHPNPPVGCVIVREGRIVGRGHTQPPPGNHAEVVALRQAGPDARSATLYSTLEPCNHHGRTPPCTEAIARAGISRVVIAVRDPNQAASGGQEALETKGVDVTSGVLSTAAEPVLRPFLHWARTGRPYVVLKSAMTLDGKTASSTGASRWITGPVARAYVHRLRQRLGAVMVGVGTALIDDPDLTVRRTFTSPQGGAQPTRIVVDSHLRLPLTSRLVQTAREHRVILACSEDADASRMALYRDHGLDVLPVGVRERRPDFAILIEELGRCGITGILLEGGGELAYSAMEAKAVREVLFFVAPKILGGREAPGPVGGAGYPEPDAGPFVRNLTVRRCGKDWLLRGFPVE